MHLMQIQRIKKKNVLKTLTALLMLRQVRCQPLKIFKNSYGTAHADCCRGAAPPFEHQLLGLIIWTFEHWNIEILEHLNIQTSKHLYNCTLEDQILCLNLHQSHIQTPQKVSKVHQCNFLADLPQDFMSMSKSEREPWVHSEWNSLVCCRPWPRCPPPSWRSAPYDGSTGSAAWTSEDSRSTSSWEKKQWKGKVPKQREKITK